MSDIQTARLAKLREPFAPNQINKLPKPYSKDAAKGNCKECGGYHGLPALHLDFVGHAALTDRFLDVDPEWSWEPLAFDAKGLPAFDEIGGLWIRLTICGVTRLGYGDAQGKTGPNAKKEIIGDALRNAGMRFGAALDLWHKGDLHEAEEASGRLEPQASAPPSDDTSDTRKKIAAEGRRLGKTVAQLSDEFAEQNGGLAITNATLAELQAFLAPMLKAKAAA